MCEDGAKGIIFDLALIRTPNYKFGLEFSACQVVFFIMAAWEPFSRLGSRGGMAADAGHWVIPQVLL